MEDYQSQEEFEHFECGEETAIGERSHSDGLEQLLERFEKLPGYEANSIQRIEARQFLIDTIAEVLKDVVPEEVSWSRDWNACRAEIQSKVNKWLK